MIKAACIIVVFAQLTAAAQSTIAYFPANPFYIPFSDSRGIDFDGDGRAEFTMDNGGMLCTADVPTSACSTYFMIGPEEGSAYLTNGNSLAILAAGDRIGPSPQGASWDSAWFGKTIFGYTLNMRDPTAEIRYTGALGIDQDGYVGVAFTLPTGVHYGWIRLEVEADAGAMPSPRVIEWAYETRPGAAILAGAKPVSIPISSIESARIGYLQVSWNSEAGKAYQVQSKTALDDHLWRNLDFVIIGTSSKTIVEVPTAGRTAFYRVVEAD